MNINQTNTPRNNAATPALLGRGGGTLDNLVRGIKTVLTSPLTLVAGLTMTLPLAAAATRVIQAGQGNGALQASDGNALGLTQPPPDIITSKPSSASVTVDYDLPVDVAAVTAAAKHALATNGKVDVGWMLYDDVCEAGLNQLLFNGKKENIASATTWRADVAGTIHLRTTLTPEQTARALGITVRDALTGEECVQSMYVDAFNMPEVEMRLEAREAVLANIKDPNADKKQCLKVEDTHIEGRNLQGVSIFQAHLEKCTPISEATPSSEHARAKRDIDAASNTAKSTSTPDADAEVLQQLADSIFKIRAEYCPTSTTIIHGTSTDTQHELNTLQAQIRALCPQTTINTFSSLNASSPSLRLGASQLVEHLASLLAAKTKDDVYVISPPALTAVLQNTQALEQIIEVLEARNVIVFSATEDGWVNNVGGVQHGGNTAVKMALKSAIRSAKEHLDTRDGFPLLPVILVIGGIALILTAAGMVVRSKRAQQQKQPQTLTGTELEVIDERELETLVNSSEQQDLEVTASEEQSALLSATSVSNISENSSIDTQLNIYGSTASLASSSSNEEEDALSAVSIESREQSSYTGSDYTENNHAKSDYAESDYSESDCGNSETSLDQSAQRFEALDSSLTRASSTQSLVLPANHKSTAFEPLNFSASMYNLSVVAENQVVEENLATEPEQSSVPVSTESAFDTETPVQEMPTQTTSLIHWPPCKPAASLTDVYRAQEKWKTSYQDGEENDVKLEELRLKLEAMRKKRENK